MFCSYGQTSHIPQRYKFRVYLKDKGDDIYSIDKAEIFLSNRAIERKKKENVEIDQSDFPISREYFTLLEKEGASIVTYSKWFSTIVIEVSDSMSVGNIAALSFVDSVKYIWRGSRSINHEEPRPRLVVSADEFLINKQINTVYGFAEDQFRMHNATVLADAGFKGNGMLLGVIDAGFTNFDVIPRFESVNIEGFENFVPYGSFFSSSDHGTKVLSTMATDLPGLLMGSAPDASYWLLRSEDTSTEFPVEEDYWVRAVEFADSVGVDIINSSLGYNSFDDTSLNYTFTDLNGFVSFMSRAADKAYEKGMLVIVSAGNEGDKAWNKITSPADARNVLAIGAVGTDNVIAPFSSHGPTADGRVKPDLVSVGVETISIGQNGAIIGTSGTSLSAPFLTGLIASLWSVNPSLHRAELIDIVKRSSDRFTHPDSIYGNGIPDFHQAFKQVLDKMEIHSERVIDSGWDIYPESSRGYNVRLTEPAFSPSSYTFRVLDESGALISIHRFNDDNAIFVSLPNKIRKNNRFLYFVTQEPFQQRIFKVRICT